MAGPNAEWKKRGGWVSSTLGCLAALKAGEMIPEMIWK
jgi:hypothetical protein